MKKQQIRAILLYEFKNGRRAADTARNINQVFGLETISERAAQYWFSRFRDGNENLEDEEGRGRPSKIEDDQLKGLIETDPRKNDS